MRIPKYKAGDSVYYADGLKIENAIIIRAVFTKHDDWKYNLATLDFCFPEYQLYSSPDELLRLIGC